VRQRFLHIQERFLTHIWSRQYLRLRELRTVDGRSVEVLEPGRFNTGAGADFLNAKVRIGATVYAGDVEIHRTPAEWFAHKHQNDPRYNTVILHVVLEVGKEFKPTLSQSGREVPLLVLEPFLSESIRELWHTTVQDEKNARSSRLPCSGKNSRLSGTFKLEWVEKLARERLELKIRRFDDRLRELAYHVQLVAEPEEEYGEEYQEIAPDELPPPPAEPTQKDLRDRSLWEQVLFEGICDGLGYSKNREPFVALAQTATLARLRQITEEDVAGEPFSTEAILFGVSGLLPSDKNDDEYIRRLNRLWSRYRAVLKIAPMESSAWVFFPLRPNNFPTVRIAAAAWCAEMLSQREGFSAIIQLLKSNASVPRKITSIEKLLTPPAHPYWNRHHSFTQISTSPVKPLGASRIRDILVNTIIPLALLYARIFKDRRVREGTLEMYGKFPTLEENSVTRRMEREVFGEKAPLSTAARQQGALHLYKFYCSGQWCGECAIGKRLGLSSVTSSDPLS